MNDDHTYFTSWLHAIKAVNSLCLSHRHFAEKKDQLRPTHIAVQQKIIAASFHIPHSSKSHNKQTFSLEH